MMGWLRVTNTSTPARPVVIVEGEPNIPADPGTDPDDWTVDVDAAHKIVNAWIDAPPMNDPGKEDTPIRAGEYLEGAEIYVTALTMDGHTNIDHWYCAEAGFWLSESPFDLEIEVLQP